MKHGSNIRRGGGRPPRNNDTNVRRFHGGSGGGGGHRYSNFESSGPEVKIRGSAQQVLEKYLALARDAASGGDRIAAENYLQHAEHYYRIINIDNANRQQGTGGQRPPQGQGQQPQGQPQHQHQHQHQHSQPSTPSDYDGGSDGGFDRSDEGFAADPRPAPGGEGPAQG